jgi:hypothetical protein
MRFSSRTLLPLLSIAVGSASIAMLVGKTVAQKARKQASF